MMMMKVAMAVRLHIILQEDVDILVFDLQEANPKNGLMQRESITRRLTNLQHDPLLACLEGEWDGECAKERGKENR